MSLDTTGPAGTGNPPASDGPVDVVRILSAPRRVAVLAELADRDASIATDELARRVAAREGEMSVDEVAESTRRTVSISLTHHHLPALESHRVVDWDREAREVTLADGVAPERAAELVDSRSLVASSRLLERLAQPRRRTVVRILGERDPPLTVDELARRVAAVEQGARPASVQETAVDRIRVSLHHSHLPALSAIGLLEYEPGSGVVDV